MSIKVSNLALEDRRDWEVLYRAYADFYSMPMTQEILDQVWSWIFDEGNAFYGFIARGDTGNPIGLMHFRAMPSPIRGAEVGFLDDLFVQSESRGKGVVEALYSALNEFSNTKGWPFVRWITADDNYRGRAVYDKLADKTHWVTYQMNID